MERRQQSVGRQPAAGNQQVVCGPLPAARDGRGFTLLELIITLGILAILAAGVIPLMKNTIKREREMELRRNLREIRQAIDRYHYACGQGLVGMLDRKVDDECYPPTLEILVEGITPPNTTRKIRFLRRLPNDPFSAKPDWGLRSIQDDKDSSSWGKQNVYDVYTKHDDKALNGTRYKEW